MSHLRVPPHGNLLIPTSHRESFVAGLSMWAACRRSARILQHGYWWAARILGPQRIPGPKEDWNPGLPAEVAAEHEARWTEWFGEYDEVAGYRPAQAGRTGFAVLLLRDRTPRGFVKCRPGWDPRHEISVGRAVAGASSFWSPEVVDSHEASGWTSVGMTPMPPLISSPRLEDSPRTIADELSHLLAGAIGDPVPGRQPMHGDMGPWNLRRLPGRKPALFDWEYAAWGPPGADLVFHDAACRAMGLPGRQNLEAWPEACAYWISEISERFGGERRDARLSRAMLGILGSYA